MGENPRKIVLDILLALEREEEFSHRLIAAVLDKYDYLEGRDKAFIKRLAEGTVERRIELDYYLDCFSSLPVRKMKPAIRCILRMGVYQLLYMDTVPDPAVCNEACRLAEGRKLGNLKGFVNGVLRSIARKKDSLPLPDRDREYGEYLSVKFSCPPWLVETWLEEYGKEATATMLEGLMRIQPVSLRFSTDMPAEGRERLLREMETGGAALRQSAYLPYIYRAQGIESVQRLPGFDSGAFTVQDVSSALAVEAAGIRPGDFVMDICAAPGGKSILAAERAWGDPAGSGPRGRVLALDISEAKTALIEENLARMGRRNVEVRVWDASVPDEDRFGAADVLLADVPCSGLGVMGKKRDIKYHVSPEGMQSIVELQKRILRSSWRYVKPGGILLYSTCTIHRQENEEMVRWILENLPFEPDDPAPYLPEALLKEIGRIPGGCGRHGPWVQLLPGYTEADGFFFARLRRKAAE